MSEDWKRKFQQQKALEAAEAQRRAEVQKAEEQAAKEREEQRRIHELARRFKCHVCGTPANGPYTWEDGDETGNFTRTNWGAPRNLFQCDHCNKWACNKHSDTYNGSIPRAARRRLSTTSNDGITRITICSQCATRMK